VDSAVAPAKARAWWLFGLVAPLAFALACAPGGGFPSESGRTVSTRAGVGVVSVPLQIAGPAGRTYRLAATFELSGPETVSVRAELSEESASDPALSLSVRAGTYAVAISSWRLYELDPTLGRYIARLDAVLESPVVRTVTIEPDRTTSLSYELLVPPAIPCAPGSCLEASAIGGSNQFSFAALSDGRVYSWGAEVIRPVFTPVQNQFVAGIDGSDFTMCIALRDRTARCWGLDLYGQLGDGPAMGAALVRPTGLPEVTSIRVGSFHVCASLVDGRVMCWGGNDFGQLGTGNTMMSHVPVVVPGISDAVQLAVGPTHACAVRGNGRVLCWGKNDRKQLGDGTASDQLSPVEVPGVGDAVEVATGAGISCARLSDGRVMCWGDNDGGLGNGAVASDTPVVVAGIADAVQIVAKGDFACARRASGDVSCWGENEGGQLGDGTTVHRATPVAVSGLKARVIGVGGAHACAAPQAGGLVCWGTNHNGELGTGVHQNTRFAASGVGFSGLTQLASHHNHTCATRDDGTVVCWGKNDRGQLGDGSRADRALAAIALGAGESGLGAVTVSAGTEHSCALTALGTVECWGGNDFDQLGTGTGEDSLAPVLVPGVGLAASIGDSHTASCATGVDQSLMCWGDGAVEPAGLNDVVSVAGHGHHCAVRSSGRVACWGDNTSGQLGDGTTVSRDGASDVLLSAGVALEGALDVSASDRHSCALLADGRVACWGDNGLGELGDGTRIASSFARIALGVDQAVDVAIGDHHSCAARQNGEVLCWGHAGILNLTGGSARDFFSRESAPPRPVLGLVDAVALAAGSEHTCALRAGGGIACWGNNRDGQAGLGVFARSTLPVAVVPFSHRCGNGTVEGSEVCDDGNTLAGDNCSTDCMRVTTMLLDRISALPQAAYSIERRLRAGYFGSAIQVRRVTPAGTQNIGFTTSGELSRASVESYCGASDCFLSILYDQGPSVRNLTQTTPSAQMKIYDGATRKLTMVGEIPIMRALTAGSSVWRGDIVGLTSNPSLTIAYKGRYSGASTGLPTLPVRIGINGTGSEAREVSLRFTPGSTDLFFGGVESTFLAQGNAYLSRVVAQRTPQAPSGDMTLRVNGTPAQKSGGTAGSQPLDLTSGRVSIGKHPSDASTASSESTTLIIWSTALGAADLAALEANL
jgi:cysteine-rich repeat protein